MAITVVMDIVGTLETQQRWPQKARKALTLLHQNREEGWDLEVEEQGEDGWVGEAGSPVLPLLETRQHSLSNSLLTSCAGQIYVNLTQAEVIWEEETSIKNRLHKIRL